MPMGVNTIKKINVWTLVTSMWEAESNEVCACGPGECPLCSHFRSSQGFILKNSHTPHDCKAHWPASCWLAHRWVHLITACTCAQWAIQSESLRVLSNHSVLFQFPVQLVSHGAHRKKTWSTRDTWQNPQDSQTNATCMTGVLINNDLAELQYNFKSVKMTHGRATWQVRSETHFLFQLWPKGLLRQIPGCCFKMQAAECCPRPTESDTWQHEVRESAVYLFFLNSSLDRYTPIRITKIRNTDNTKC